MGDWRVHQDDEGRILILDGEDSVIAEVHGGDAHLIGAAPDLVKALWRVRDIVHAHNRGGELRLSPRQTIRNVCDRALAKAEGKS